MASANVEQLITDRIDLWTSAIEKKSSSGRGSSKKQSLYGIKKLRELILELAVRGKLVPQDPNDEPASVLLERIAEERYQLVKDKRIKKTKKLAPITDDEQPFLLPKGWDWVRLDNLSPVSLMDGDWIESKDQDPEGDIRLIQLADVGVNIFKDQSDKFINEETLNRLNCTELNRGDVLIARLPSPIGRACIFPRLHQKAITAVDVAILRLNGSLNSQFLVHGINSITFRSQVEAYGKGATRFRISTGNLKGILIPLAPYNEQVRIASKVDELMALCDQLEEQTENNIEAHQVLVETLLGTLTQSQNADELAENWERVAEHFDTLFTTEHSIDQLKQTILQLAVMGKLVPQDPNDEPASVLLKRITAEKEQMIKDKKIKKQKSLRPIEEAEKAFLLPEGWCFVRLSDAIDVRDGTHDSPKDSLDEDTFPLITSKNFSNGEIDFDNARRISSKDHYEIAKRSRVDEGDILFSMIGGNIGNQVMVKDSRPFSIKNVALFKYYSIESVSPDYLYLYTQNLANGLQEKAVGGAQPFISLGALRNLVFPLAPINEQHRIVAKVNQLMSFCDQIKTSLQQAQQTQLSLAEGITDQALEG